MSSRSRILEYKGKQNSYEPSNTELLLEDICTSFSTELLDAHIDWSGGWPLLWRLSRPVTLQNQKDSKKRSVHFQYTKFSPFDNATTDLEHLAEAYNKNRQLHGRQIIKKSIRDVIFKDIKEKCGVDIENNFMMLLFDTKPVDCLNIKRYPKEVYVAIYEGNPREEGRAIFKINEVVNYPNTTLLPEVHITYRRPTIFFIGSSVEEGIKDDLIISNPRVTREDPYLNEALSLHKIKLESHKLPNPCRYLLLPSNTSVHQDKAVMGLIQTYVRNICLGRTL